MPYINVDEAYILDNTGLQVDKSVDYANANSNRNLLDNSWFTINQRSATTIPVGGYGVDRWKGGSVGAANVVSGGLQFVGRANAYQIPPSGFWDNLLNRTCTASLLFSDGTVESGSKIITSGVVEFGTYNGVRIFKSSSNNFNLESDSGANCIVRAVKLELGSYSTLINDTTPDYGEELRKCQYYYREIKCTTTGYAMIGYATASTAFQACLPYVMRVRPTITYSGTLNAYYAGGNSLVTAVAANGEFTNSVQVAFTTSGLTAGSIVALAMGSGAKLMFSADL